MSVVSVSRYVERAGPGVLAVHRLVEDGYEVLHVRLPAVVTVVKEIADPRLPTLRGKRKARELDIPVWGPEDLGLDPQDLGLKGSPTRVVKIFRPKLARTCEKAHVKDEASLDQAADRFVDFLKEKHLL